MKKGLNKKFIKGVSVAASSSEGLGVFATRDFRVESWLGEIGGKVFPAHFESDYAMDLDGKAVLDPIGPFRFLNHSCEPNCQLVLWKQRKVKGKKLPRLWVVAIGPIRSGDELTIDYAWPAESAVPCLCRADSCRGWVVAEDDLPKL